eukprot:11075755-Heterocapsa_arctica.AAC.1
MTTSYQRLLHSHMVVYRVLRTHFRYYIEGSNNPMFCFRYQQCWASFSDWNATLMAPSLRGALCAFAPWDVLGLHNAQGPITIVPGPIQSLAEEDSLLVKHVRQCFELLFQ